MPNHYKFQKTFCETYERLILVPYDGYCYRCGKNIWDRYTAEDASGRYLTGCPFCHRGFSE